MEDRKLPNGKGEPKQHRRCNEKNFRGHDARVLCTKFNKISIQTAKLRKITVEQRMTTGLYARALPILQAYRKRISGVL